MSSLVETDMMIEIDIQVVKPGMLGYTVSLVSYRVDKFSSRPEILIPDFIDTIKDLTSLMIDSNLRDEQVIKLTQIRPLTVIADFNYKDHANPSWNYKSQIYDLTDLDIDNDIQQYLDYKDKVRQSGALLIPKKPIQTSREYSIVNPKDYKLIIRDYDHRYREEWEMGGGEREDQHKTWVDNTTK